MPQLTYGMVSYSFNEATPAADTAGIEFRLPQSDIGFLAWSTSFLTNPSVVSIKLQGSNDNSVWSDLDSTTDVNGELRQIYVSTQYIRAYHTSRTGGTGVSVLFNVLPASSNFISGVRSLKGQFEILQNPALSNADVPVFRVTTVDDTPWGIVIGNENFSPVPNAGLGLYATSTIAGINSSGADGVTPAPMFISASVLTLLSDDEVPAFTASPLLTELNSPQDVNIISNGVITIGGGGTTHVAFNSPFVLGDNNYIEGPEITPPSNAGANRGILFFQDNGSGKTQLCVVFSSGAVQVIATQP